MARRASSGVNTQALIMGVVVLIVILGGAFWFLNRGSSNFDAPELDVDQALQNSRSLSGNRYQTTGKLIDRRIEANGQVVVLEYGDGISAKHLPIVVPTSFEGGNLNLQADYTFLIEFNTRGLAVAQDVKQP